MLVASLAAIVLAGCTTGEDEGTQGTVNGEKTYAIISLTQNSSPQTYAAVAAPTDQEKVVKSVTLFVFNSTLILEKIVVFDDPAQPQLAEMTTGMHYFYAAVNIPSAKLTGIAANSTTMVGFEKKLMGTFNDVAPLTDQVNGFWMTNVNRPSGINLVVATQAQAPTLNNIVIEVGRAAVKVAVEFAPETQNDGLLSNVDFKLSAIPNDMYLMPFTNLNVLQPPYWSAGYVAANYFRAAGYTAATTAATPAWAYCIENANQNPQQGTATYAIVHGVFTPDASVWLDGTTGAFIGTSATPGDDFWRIANYDGTPGPNAKILSWEDGYFNSEPAAFVVKANQGAVKYTGGNTYYPIWLTNYSIAAGNAGRYTAKRNSYYYITINSVSGAGYNTEDGVIPDPYAPVTAPTWINANIVVLDWTVIEQPTGI